MAVATKKKSGARPTNPKLYARVKSEAKRKFKVYPSAYANIWASKYCKGTVGRSKKASGGICKVASKGKGNAYGKNS